MIEYPLKRKFLIYLLFFSIFFFLLIIFKHLKNSEATFQVIITGIFESLPIVLLFVAFVTSLEYLYTVHLIPFTTRRFVKKILAPTLEPLGFKISEGKDFLSGHIENFPVTISPLEGDLQIAYLITMKCKRTQVEEFLKRASEIKRGLSRKIDQALPEGYYSFQGIVSSVFFANRAIARMLAEIKKMIAIMISLNIQPHEYTT